MTTLQDLRKAKFTTVKEFAKACGFSVTKATTVLQGRHMQAITPYEMQHIAGILGVSYQAFVDAQEESYNTWYDKNVHSKVEAHRKRYDELFPADVLGKSPIYLVPITNLKKYND